MAVYNTPSDSANTAVRAFLTKVGEYYLGYSFNTGSGKGKKIWQEIREEEFQSTCAYCGVRADKLQIEHLFMFNRAEYGLHHPGNIVPCCSCCNKRTRLPGGGYTDWKQHLQQVCSTHGHEENYEARKQKIDQHFKKYNYPDLNVNELHSIRVIANSLYENIKAESEKSLLLYKQLDEAFVQEST
ncbi:HNH endonuclease [Photobacterium lutimaris]|uniref:HNH endonuclease n=1 Tax=Photobacterium lutimaris TaxID=388278 RepID=A0A2T3ITY6_9GAMM|nr:HNH endonuclease [Photobacterium lutimaris]PSU31836.1 HNH endonuclease [Photobacterium lutimaris]TDR73358.1 hypothetical protein DFP78_1111 [Photobacterium lutimaris]